MSERDSDRRDSKHREEIAREPATTYESVSNQDLADAASQLHADAGAATDDQPTIISKNPPQAVRREPLFGGGLHGRKRCKPRFFIARRGAHLYCSITDLCQLPERAGNVQPSAEYEPGMDWP